MPKPHDVLQISSTATLAEVRAAYKSLAAKHHPDKGGDPDEFARINAAHRALSTTLRARGAFDDLFTDLAKELRK